MTIDLEHLLPNLCQELLPAAYQDYVAVVAAGLECFLEQLDDEEQSAIVTAQVALPPDAPAALRAVALFRECPTLHKLGQVVARDRRLHPAFRRQLQTLESLPGSTPVSTVEALLRRELAGSGVVWADQPLAEASVAMVIPCWDSDGNEGVLKVLRPGIANRLQRELAALGPVRDCLAVEAERHGLPLPYAEALDQVAAILASEVDMQREQTHLHEAAELYRNSDTIVVPGLLPYSGPRLTAMTRLHGVPITAAPPDRGASLARQLQQELLARPFWQAGADPLFHGDPHGGNLLYTDDDRIGVLDWSLAERLPKQLREELVQLILAGLLQNGSTMERALTAIAISPPPPLDDIIRDSMREIRQGHFSGLDWLSRLLDRAASRGLALPAVFVLFRKVLLSLEGVCQDLDPASNPDPALVARALQGWCYHWPWLLGQSRPGSPLHLSGEDLWRLGWQLPWLMPRYWQGYLSDVSE